MALQTRAVSLFNSSFADVNESNCVPILLFSSVLGQHFLTSTLAERHSGGLDAFMSNYIHCVEIHRGIHVVAMQYWPQLMESELAPILAASSRFTSRTPKGNTCQHISELVAGSEALSLDEKEACHSVIQHLQIGFDAVLEGEGKSGYNHYMIYTWLMLAPPKFIDLLSEKRPEALVLLAYYALLLHYGRHVWQVKDAGHFLLGIIRDYLHPTWHSWLIYPQSQVSEDP
ncbi:hypothetical protein N7456_008851 [Penicillium angulare]|uniref:Uncharacterized protein n=1 Tax=Penicillium angulare TaxID=116970 RepID=A0A9W9F3K5_9EURO|nr:hypothetical protein N7456_008851 [Penicillium angulare]